MSGTTIEIIQPSKFKKVKKFILPNGQVKEGGIENLDGVGDDVEGVGGTKRPPKFN